MAYLYRHIRLDKNIPFYIGIGSDNGGEYKRAHDTGLRNRNKYWNNIVGKTAYSIEIMLDNLTWEEACAKEIEFIALYGRRNDGGILANLTLGGEGQLGMLKELNGMYGRKASIETRQKQSLRKKGKPAPNKGKPMPKDQLANLVKINTGRPSPRKGKKLSPEHIEKTRQTKLKNGTHKGANHWNYGKKMTDFVKEKLKAANKGRKPWCAGKKMSEELCLRGRLNKPMKPVVQYTLDGVLVREFISCGEAARETGLLKTSISRACLKIGNTKTYKGYAWEYKATN